MHSALPQSNRNLRQRSDTPLRNITDLDAQDREPSELRDAADRSTYKRSTAVHPGAGANARNCTGSCPACTADAQTPAPTRSTNRFDPARVSAQGCARHDPSRRSRELQHCQLACTEGATHHPPASVSFWGSKRHASDNSQQISLADSGSYKEGEAIKKQTKGE